MSCHRDCRGFTYLGLLLLMAIAGVALAAIGQGWHSEMQREKEKELLFIGSQLRQAIGSYYENTPSGIKQYPLALEELVHDDRFPKTKHHLRRIYADPMTDSTEWGLEKQQGRIVGVYSVSLQRPLKKAGFVPEYESFATAARYQDWRFVYVSGLGETNMAGTGASAVPAPALPTVSESTSPQTDYSKQQACLGQRVSDTGACTTYCKASGMGGGCSRCQASILVRYGACLKGESLPALADG